MKNQLYLRLLGVALMISVHFFAQAQSVTLTPDGAWIPSYTTTARTAITPTDGQLVYDTDTKSFWYGKSTVWTEIGASTLTETDPQVASSTTNYIPKWNGTTLQDGILYDNGSRVGIGTTTIANESRLALGAVDDSEGEGGQLQLNSASSSTRAYYLDNSNDVFRIMSGTNTGATDLRMKISSTGDVGIGAIGTPRGKLDVDGKTVTTNFQMTNGATNGYVLQSDANGNGSWVNASTLSITETDPKIGTLTSNYLPIWNGSTLANGQLYDNGSRIMIGTTNPSYGNNLNYSKLTLRSNNSSTSDLNLVGSVSNTYSPYLNFGKARGSSLTSFTAAESGDYLMGITANGYSGTSFVEAAAIHAIIDDIPSSTSVPGRLVFKTTESGESGTTERMRITNNGNIGIGTSAPIAKLDVAGKTRTTTFQMTTNPTNGYILQSDADGNASWVNPATFSIGNWTTSGTNQYNALSGNVGIGTTTPSVKLDVSGTTSTTNLKITSGATNGYVLQSDANGNASWVNPTSFTTAETDPQVASSTTNYVPKWNGTALQDGILYDKGTGIGISTTTVASESRLAVGAATTEEGGQIQLNSGMLRFVAYFLDNSEDKFRIMSGTNSGSTTTHLTITENGNVGLGTQSPAEKLDVQGKTKTTNFQMTEGATNNYVLQSDANGNATWVNPSTLTTASSNWTTSSTNQYSALSGNVGIGTTAPDTKLHVSGNTTLAGTVNFNNDWNIQTGSDFWLERNGTRHLTVYGFDGATGIATATPKSTLDVAGSVGFKISTQSGSTDVTLDNSATVWYFTGSAAIILPAAGSCPNRFYKIMNRSYGNRTISSFMNHLGLPTTSISANSAIELISDGTNWLKIN